MFRKLIDAFKRSAVLMSLLQWIDSDAKADDIAERMPPGKGRVEWVRIMPFIFLHVMCLAVIFTGWSPTAVYTAIALYFIRMFAVTAFYHRYFSHRTFRASRSVQFVFALLATSSVQRGPLWWAAHHRYHHQYVDTDKDPHSPSRHGFIWSHIGWLTSSDNFRTRYENVRDWVKYPELVWINRFDIVVPVILAVLLFMFGEILAALAPELGTNGFQMLVWGFFISTIAVMHATFTINSLDHMFGSRRYNTDDTSRNNALLAVLTLGEGWHNNHHHYAISSRQGFFWWEIDITYYFLYIMSVLGVIGDLRPVPDSIRNADLIKSSK